MPGIITHNNSVLEIIKQYYSTISTINNTNFGIENLYCFFAYNTEKVGGVANTPLQTPAALKNIYKNFITLKKIHPANICPVIDRFDWTTGTIYTPYTDSIDILAKDTNGKNITQFYVRNRFDQVFKCLWNNNGTASTIEPTIEPGTFNIYNVVITSDGYKWKYIYTIDQGLKRNFFTSNVMPITISYLPQNPSIYGGGTIDVINVTSNGIGYSNGTNTTIVTITGDGNSANAIATVVNNQVKDVLMSNTGFNYSFANVSISPALGYSGNSANAIASISPIGGHGNNLLSEFGCNKLMISCELFNSDIPLRPLFQINKVGLLANPYSNNDYTKYASGEVYNAYTILTLNQSINNTDVFLTGDVIYQGDANNPSFQATVLDHDSTTGLLYIINLIGTPQLNTLINGRITKLVLGITNPTLALYSGMILNVQNYNDGQINTPSNNASTLINFTLTF